MIIFTIIGIIVVACMLISYFNSKTLTYEQKTTIVGLVLLAHEGSNLGEYQKAINCIDKALNIDPYNQKLREVKNAFTAASKTKTKISDSFMANALNDLTNHYRL